MSDSGKKPYREPNSLDWWPDSLDRDSGKKTYEADPKPVPKKKPKKR